MRVCQTYGISHSFFSGGKNRWTALDRDKAMAYDMTVLEECPKCHTLESDWKDEDGKLLEAPVWTPVARTCPGCAELERLQSKVPKETQGSYVALIPFDELGEDDDAWIDEVERRKIVAQMAKQGLV